MAISSSLNFPRILFITSSAFNRTTGGGITFSNLFYGWPRHSIATLHNDPVPIVADICDNYFRLSARELGKWGPLRMFDRSIAGIPVVSGSDGSGKQASGMQRTLKCFKRIIFGDAVPESVKITPELAQWIENFKPELIYTILGTNGMMELVHAVAVKYRLPLVIHMMDDWPAVVYRGGILSWLQRRRMQRNLGKIFSMAKVRMGICDEMCRAYEVRYGVLFRAFQNTIDTVKWYPPKGMNPDIKGEARLLYVGSILPDAQLDSLIDCCKAVVQLAGQGVKLRLDIYSPSFLAEQYRDRLVIGSMITLNDTVTEDDRFFGLLWQADILLLPVNFDEKTIRYIKYSMPTKVPAYLASGTPILVYGPPAIAQVRYALDEKWGAVVSKQGVRFVAEGLRQLMACVTDREEISGNAIRVARKSHDSRIIRKKFQQVLCKAGER